MTKTSKLKQVVFALLILQSLVQAQIVSILSPEKMEELLVAIDDKVFTNGARPLPLEATHCRAAFHDCAGGCDGSINTGNSENNGLTGYVRQLFRVYTDPATSLFRDTLTYADFTNLVQIRALSNAIKNGVRNSGSEYILPASLPVYTYGRPNNTEGHDSDSQEGPFPDSIANWDNPSNPNDVTTVLGSIRSSLKGRINEA